MRRERVEIEGRRGEGERWSPKKISGRFVGRVKDGESGALLRFSGQ